jgi:hypothetical protein
MVLCFLEANRATCKLLMAETMLGSFVLFNVFLDCIFMGNMHWSFFGGVGFKRTFSRFMVSCIKGSPVRICFPAVHTYYYILSDALIHDHLFVFCFFEFRLMIHDITPATTSAHAPRSAVGARYRWKASS